MTSVAKSNSYEEARQQRLLENKRKFEDLGILTISKDLTGLTKSPAKMKVRQFRQKASETSIMEPRRSSRARNPVSSYHDIAIELPRERKRSNFSSLWASYLARPLAEVKSATLEERALAMQCAEELPSNLQSGNPSFIKSMVRLHVYSCFWLVSSNGIGTLSSKFSWNFNTLCDKTNSIIYFHKSSVQRFIVFRSVSQFTDSEEIETKSKRNKKPASSSKDSLQPKKGNPNWTLARQQKMRNEKQ